MAASILSSSWPARPTKGLPSMSSSRPGASPMIMTRAVRRAAIEAQVLRGRLEPAAVEGSQRRLELVRGSSAFGRQCARPSSAASGGVRRELAQLWRGWRQAALDAAMGRSSRLPVAAWQGGAGRGDCSGLAAAIVEGSRKSWPGGASPRSSQSMASLRVHRIDAHGPIPVEQGARACGCRGRTCMGASLAQPVRNSTFAREVDGHGGVQWVGPIAA